ncbi:MAG: phosphoribosyl-AMP cyclohydrolase [Christensenellaceae bacterium]|jgi:phosphoribosyl-AMP cyclohydrolase|nr:phosphoribosyl-AMP cyclohydrolase [Christensenellaceae bacterium]
MTITLPPMWHSIENKLMPVNTKNPAPEHCAQMTFDEAFQLSASLMTKLESETGDNSDAKTLLNTMFSGDRLIPVIVQDATTGMNLMLAYSNIQSFYYTLKTGLAHYYSRSRDKLWMKGETSGHIQRICGIFSDCDSDTLLFVVEQTGVACHTGRSSCFFNRII